MKKILSKGHTRGSRWIALPVLALAVLLSIVVAWCMEPPAENAELMYVFVDNDDQVHIIDREHQIAYETESLPFHTDTSADPAAQEGKRHHHEGWGNLHRRRAPRDGGKPPAAHGSRARRGRDGRAKRAG